MRNHVNQEQTQLKAILRLLPQEVTKFSSNEELEGIS